MKEIPKESCDFLLPIIHLRSSFRKKPVSFCSNVYLVNKIIFNVGNLKTINCHWTMAKFYKDFVVKINLTTKVAKV